MARGGHKQATGPRAAQQSPWFEQALDALSEAGPPGRHGADYIRRKRLRLGFTPQKHTGAAWFDPRRLRYGVFLNTHLADARPTDPQVSALLVHEALHREQGVWEALSVRGELRAWQVQYDVLAGLSAAPSRHGERWRQLRALDPSARADLRSARQLMAEIAGPGYRIGWLPLWPLPEEIMYRLGALMRRMRMRSPLL